MTGAIGTAVAKRQEKDTTPRGLIESYSSDFTAVLPSHIKPVTWIRVAQGALKKGRKAKGDPEGRFELEVAASNNPAAFLSALLDAARQGLEPGTEQYYLTPRMQRGRLEILGMRGYQGEIELIYRAGAVSTVIAEVVRKNDQFRYKRGEDEVPIHDYPPFAGEKTRGELIGVYAYARMKDGAVSRVVTLGQDDIDRIKSFAQGVDSEYSPWNTSTEAMWLKSAVHQLQKWVPTSAEYLTNIARAAGTAMGAAQAEAAKQGVTAPPLRAEQDYGANPNMNGDMSIDSDVVDAEVVPDPEPAAPAAEAPRSTTSRVIAPSAAQLGMMHAMLRTAGKGEQSAGLAYIAGIIGRRLTTSDEMSRQDVSKVIDALKTLTAEKEKAAAETPPADVDPATGEYTGTEDMWAAASNR